MSAIEFPRHRKPQRSGGQAGHGRAIALLCLIMAPAMTMADDTTNAAVGKQVYENTCIACHGADGKGTVPGAPDFTRPDGVLAKPDEELLHHMINGFQEPGNLLAMPPKGGDANLTESDLHSVLHYLRQRFAGVATR